MGERGGKQIYEGEFVHAKEFSVVFLKLEMQKNIFKKTHSNYALVY